MDYGSLRLAPEARGTTGAAQPRHATGALRRLVLEMSDRHAAGIAAAIAETTAVAPEIARLQGIALAGVFEIIITEAGRRTREGHSQDQIAGELRPAIEAVLDDLDRWLTPARE
jgi:hypothetical protein